MYCEHRRVLWHAALLTLIAAPAHSSVIPRLAFEELVDGAEQIVHGRIVRVWSGWDRAHRYIWTHYEVQVLEPLKGAANFTIRVSEPGGTLDGLTMEIGGAVRCRLGEEVVLFTYQTPAGFRRILGHAQGKLMVVEDRVEADAKELARAGSMKPSQENAAQTAMEATRGMRLADLKARIRERLRSTRQ